MEKKNEVLGVLALNIEQDVVKKSVLYGKYRNVGTFDIRHQSVLNIYIHCMYVIYITWLFSVYQPL